MEAVVKGVDEKTTRNFLGLPKDQGVCYGCGRGLEERVPEDNWQSNSTLLTVGNEDGHERFWRGVDRLCHCSLTTGSDSLTRLRRYTWTRSGTETLYQFLLFGTTSDPLNRHHTRHSTMMYRG